MGKHVMVLLPVVLCLRACLAVPSTNFTDEYALLAFKAHITSDPNILGKNWSERTSFCNWVGVSCSHMHQKVKALNLPNMDLRGTIPREIGNLASLDISNNNFHGHLPDELGLLHRMKSINLQFNELSGSIPTSFGFLTKLQHMILSYNSFTGSIPQEIGNLLNLQTVYLDNNSISGFIPSTFFNMSSLQRVSLSNNELYGNLPADICTHLPLLASFSASNNQLSGEIPSSLSDCGELRQLSLGGNKFSGSIPGATGNLMKLEELDLSHDWNGSIPKIGNLKHISGLDLWKNQITGDIPSTIGELQSLEFLNYLRTDYKSLEKLLDLTYFNVSSNKLSGEIPDGGSFANFNTESFRQNDALCGAPQFHVKACNSHRQSGETRVLLKYVAPLIGSLLWNCIDGNVYKKEANRRSIFWRTEFEHWVHKSFPNAVMEVADVNLLRREEENLAAVQNCLSFLFGLALECTAESPEERINMKDVLLRLKKIHDNIMGT
ncbi:hypothetical protein F0562_010638 [Nyssa sinensis]|uniref:Leucine-rich repeat-containing N-terminal plant-type domain-containing protein n=1 Tax=Nyssa sinensis TaxID=561372 RepID=A0A5J5A2K1_9ASTE|nr:hypothetical protein F0562_010638 [Nyssa sinensis]